MQLLNTKNSCRMVEKWFEFVTTAHTDENVRTECLCKKKPGAATVTSPERVKVRVIEFN